MRVTQRMLIASSMIPHCGAAGRHGQQGYGKQVVSVLSVPSIYSIGPPNGGSALRHGHHFEPADFEIDQGRGHHDAHSAESCQRTLCMGMWLPAASTPPQIVIDRSPAEVVRPRDARNDDASHRPEARKRPCRNRAAEWVVHPVYPCRATSGSSNRDNNRGMSQECAANASRSG